MCSDERCWDKAGFDVAGTYTFTYASTPDGPTDKEFEDYFVRPEPAVAAATRVFWNDLERDMEDPFYRRVHIAASLLMGNTDVQPVEDGSIPS